MTIAAIEPAPPRRWTRRTTVPAALCATLALWPAPRASAQNEASPQTLYDCTTLTDPAQLQQCIVRGQGGRKIRGKLSSTPKAPDAPIYRDSETPDTKIPSGSGPP